MTIGVVIAIRRSPERLDTREASDTMPVASATAPQPSKPPEFDRPWSPSPALSWSSSGTCSPTPPRATATSAQATTPTASTRTAKPATTSASSKHSGSPSPSPRPPDSAQESAAQPGTVDFPVSAVVDVAGLDPVAGCGGEYQALVVPPLARLEPLLDLAPAGLRQHRHERAWQRRRWRWTLVTNETDDEVLGAFRRAGVEVVTAS